MRQASMENRESRTKETVQLMGPLDVMFKGGCSVGKTWEF